MNRKKRGLILICIPIVLEAIIFGIVVATAGLPQVDKILLDYFLNLIGALVLFGGLIMIPFGIVDLIKVKGGKKVKTMNPRKKIALRLFIVPPVVLLAGEFLGRFIFPLSLADAASMAHAVYAILNVVVIMAGQLGFWGMIIGWPLGMYYAATPNKETK